jgi:hypothetical protein
LLHLAQLPDFHGLQASLVNRFWSQLERLRQVQKTSRTSLPKTPWNGRTTPFAVQCESDIRRFAD